MMKRGKQIGARCKYYDLLKLAWRISEMERRSWGRGEQSRKGREFPAPPVLIPTTVTKRPSFYEKKYAVYIVNTMQPLSVTHTSTQ